MAHPRRSFLGRSIAGAGLAVLAGRHAAAGPKAVPKQERLPREVWIATISMHRVGGATPRELSRQALALMKETLSMEPDIICLPETCLTGNLTAAAPPIEQVADAPIGEWLQPFADFAAKHQCYVVCPLHTSHDGKIFNAAVLLDRGGEYVGEYRKIHPTVGEVNKQVVPGPLQPPVFKTDFGIVGAQICFDIEWDDGWRGLRDQGAEIVFWPSAFAGGTMVNAKAWRNQYCVVSSTLKDTSKICDVTGTEVGRTGRWNQWVCGSVNLEKAFLHTWPYVKRFGDIQKKYGRKVRIQNFAEEEWSIIESRSPDVLIADLLKEFDLKTIREHLSIADAEQCRCRV